MKHLLAPLLLTALGCQGAGALYHNPEYARRPQINASFIRDDKAMLSEEAIRTLLESRIKIPDRVKLAVLPLGHQGAFAESCWSRGTTRPVEFLQEHKRYLAALDGPLSETGRFSEITHVPSLMLPEDPSLTRLREAAALMQADLLLIYSTRSQMLTARYLLAADEVKTTASIELVLLDVRTGVVPYAETFDLEHLDTESREDWSIVDIQRRSEREATSAVMRRAADGLKSFLSR